MMVLWLFSQLGALEGCHSLLCMWTIHWDRWTGFVVIFITLTITQQYDDIIASSSQLSLASSTSIFCITYKVVSMLERKKIETDDVDTKVPFNICKYETCSVLNIVRIAKLLMVRLLWLSWFLGLNGQKFQHLYKSSHVLFYRLHSLTFTKLLLASYLLNVMSCISCEGNHFLSQMSDSRSLTITSTQWEGMPLYLLLDSSR